MFYYGGLRCSGCGSRLELTVRFDGLSQYAERYSKSDSTWDWAVYLDCTKCARTFLICRTPNEKYISADTELLMYKGGDENA